MNGGRTGTGTCSAPRRILSLTVPARNGVLRSGSRWGGELLASYWRVIGKFATAAYERGNASEATAHGRRCSPPARALRRSACRARARPGRAAHLEGRAATLERQPGSRPDRV